MHKELEVAKNINLE